MFTFSHVGHTVEKFRLVLTLGSLNDEYVDSLPVRFSDQMTHFYSQ